MIGEGVVWAVFLLPLASFVVISLIIRPFLDRYSILSGLLLIGCLAVSFGLSIWILRSANHGVVLEFAPHTWLDLGAASIEIGLLMDPVTNVMLVVVTGVSLMVQVYSLGYMRGDPGFSRYYAYMSLFTASMLGLVLATNVVQLYAFWELVGISSYLLIGFWHHRPAAAAAAKKAFIITRIGDVGFLMAIIYLFLQADQFAAAGRNALHIPDIWAAAQPVAAGGLGILAGTALLWVCLGIFAGAAGKSGQFPLHTWLPDAMEGPTPVSALIHAATMVAAGVFLVARFFPVFQESQQALTVVALIGAFTAFMAATLGLVMNDIKRVMAYSTISQLGYMMAALGVGAFAAALFHLFTHAFFKALLFLASGSVNHATGTFNMRYMGGLWRKMPWTYAVTLIGALSLVGVAPFAGFWSKDEILLGAFAGAYPGGELLDRRVSFLVFGLLLAAVLLTAFYTFRMVYLTFHGEFRGGGEREIADAEGNQIPAPVGVSEQVHLGESPWVMVLPMLLLAFAALVSGYLVNPQWVESFLLIPQHWITEYLAQALTYQHLELPSFDLTMAVVSNVIAVIGIVLASQLYLRRKKGRATEESAVEESGMTGMTMKDPLEKSKSVHLLLTQKYYLDDLYENLIVRRWFYGFLAAVADWVDRSLVDGLVDLIGGATRNSGKVLALLQTGQVQFYGSVVIFGVIAILVGFLLFGSGV